jgi:pimeloyl-ACP methyl ester carboxylesterase
MTEARAPHHLSKKVKIPMLFRFIRWVVPKLEKLNPILVEKLSVAIFLRPFRMPVSQNAVEIESSAIQTKTIIDGNAIQTYKWGNGPYVLLVHGWSSCAMQFHTMIKHLLESGHSVLAFDAYGHGKSPGNKSTVLYIRDAVANLCKNNIVIGIVGHSLGSAGSILAIKENSFHIPTVIIAPNVTKEAIIKIFIDKIKAKQNLSTAFDNYCIKHYGAPFKEFTLERFSDDLHEFPLLIIHDEKDRESLLSESQYLSEKLKFSRLAVTKGLGHNRILHDSDTIKLMSEFIDEER